MRRTASEPRRHGAGFTLVELIVSIALIGLLSMAAIPLLRLPLEGWMDATRRATLTTEIDVIHTKLKSDLGQAMPGSVRVRTVGPRVLLEYLEVRASGRYSTVPLTAGAPLCPVSCGGTPGANDVLEPSCAETCFVNRSPWNGGTPAVTSTDWVVVNPFTTANNDPYTAALRTPAVAAAANGRVDMVAHSFPGAGALNRFYIVTGPVSYECDAQTRQLTRYWNYPLRPAQPVAFPRANSAVLSTRVQSCANALSYVSTGLLNASPPPPPPVVPPVYLGGVVNVLLRLGPSLTEPSSTEEAVLQASFTVSEEP